MKIKLHLIIVCLLLFLAGGSVIHAADPWKYPTDKPDGKFGGGTGDLYNPYLINNAQQLADLAYMVNHGEYFKGKYFKLTTDITLNDNVLNAEGTPNISGTFKEWTPIGEFGVFSDDDFMGTFDGCGHTIRGFYMKDSKVQFSGLFGTVKEARVKNINMEDCLISSNFGVFARYDVQCAGILCGKAYRSSFNNIKVSRALITKNGEGKHDVILGGIIGRCEARDKNWGQVFLANSSFEGTISNFMVKRAERFSAGGLVGYVSNCGKGGIVDCTAKGNIYADSETIDLEGYVIVGGIVGGSYANDANTPIRNCVNYMDLHFQLISTNETEPDVTSYLISAFGNSGGFSLKNCVNFGNVYVGKNDGKKRDMSTLYLYSMRANEMEDCANYGEFIFLGQFGDPTGKSDKIKPPKRVASMSADKFTRCITIQDGNDIPTLNGVKVFPIRHTSNPEEGGTLTDCHFYYHNNNTAGDLFTSADIPSGATRHSSLSDFTTSKPFFSGGEWGVIDDATNAYKGYPMPVACGALSTAYKGDGSLDKPYIINTEADLNKLKKAVNDGSAFKDTYFKLGSDIFITGLLDECIGNVSEKPFMGHFDGCGHAIVGLRKSLFGYMYGTVKNLALVDCDIWDGNYATALARQVGNTDNKAEVSNCYVSGTIAFSTPWNQLGYASTFAFQVAKGSSVHDCYFKGRFIVKEQTFSTYNVAGIAIYDANTVNTSADSPAGIFNCYASFDVKVEASVGQTRYTYGISSESSNDESKGNYFVCSDNGVHQSNQGGIKLNSESELNEKFKDKSAWLQGVYRPVLASAKNYAATTPEATPKTVYFDAIPEENAEKNYIYNVTLSGDPSADVTVWQLPNVAVYVEDSQMEYIINGNLDQSADFKYKRAAGASATFGQLRYTLKQNASGYHMLCLPGVVNRDDLPDNGKVMIYGKVFGESGSQEINEVHVDTIPAGVPCILFVPTSAYAVDSDIQLVMRGDIRTEPLVDANYSNMKGTFKTVANVSDACITADKHGDGEVYFKKSASAVSMKPFTAWLEGATGDVKIVDYVLLDEENEAMTVTLAGLNSTAESPKTTNVKMRRTVKLGQWNTICLPFDLTKAEVETVFGSGTKVEELSSLNYDETSQSYTLVFAAVTETNGSFIKAGTPYLIKPGTAKTEEQTSVQLYGFTAKNIICPVDKNYLYIPDGKEVTNVEKSTSLTMQGEYNHRMISPYEATDGKSLYVISGDKIYHVNSDVEMKGFRCYFVAEESTTGSTEGGTGEVGTSMFSNARVLHSDGTSTDLRLIKAEPAGDADAVYDLLGRKRDGQTKGVVIKNGKKVLKK